MVSRITTPLARKRPFHSISMKISRLMRAARETSKFHNLLLLTNNRRRYMAEMLPIRRKTPSNQSIISISSTSFALLCKFNVVLTPFINVLQYRINILCQHHVYIVHIVDIAILYDIESTSCRHRYNNVEIAIY